MSICIYSKLVKTLEPWRALTLVFDLQRGPFPLNTYKKQSFQYQGPHQSRFLSQPMIRCAIYWPLRLQSRFEGAWHYLGSTQELYQLMHETNGGRTLTSNGPCLGRLLYYY